MPWLDEFSLLGLGLPNPRSRKRAFHLRWNASDVYLALCAGEQEANPKIMGKMGFPT